MTLDVGSRLGHYDVTALIGPGGTGNALEAAHERGVIHGDLKRQREGQGRRHSEGAVNPTAGWTTSSLWR